MNGDCKLCSDYYLYCKLCNPTVCTFCQTGYTLSGGLCYCTSGTFMANGACSLLKGCITNSTITSGAFCVTCDISNNFYMLINMTCECADYTAFDNYTGKCLGICGDGYAFANDCDLGSPYNGMPGYGCDSNCHIVSGWYCSSPSNNSASICVIKTVYSGQYLYATK